MGGKAKRPLTEEGLVQADDAGVGEGRQQADLIERREHLLVVQRPHVHLLEGIGLLVGRARDLCGIRVRHDSPSRYAESAPIQGNERNHLGPGWAGSGGDLFGMCTGGVYGFGNRLVRCRWGPTGLRQGWTGTHLMHAGEGALS